MKTSVGRAISVTSVRVRVRVCVFVLCVVLLVVEKGESLVLVATSAFPVHPCLLFSTPFTLHRLFSSSKNVVL